MPKVTIKDVASKAGVSPSTVSQFLNKRYQHMGPDTRERIEAVIRELDYQPNGIARSLKMKKTNTIGVVVANILHSFSTYVSRGIEDYCHNHNYNVILCNADNNPEKERNYLQMLKMKQVDGIIIAATGANNEFIEKDIKRHIPIVQFDRFFDNLESDRVLADNYNGAYEAVSHLIKHHHRRIALVVPDGPLVSVRKQRMDGYRQALINNGIPVEQSLVKFISEKNAKKRLDELFQREQPPTAIFVTNDLMAIQVLTYLKRNHKRIPEDVSIVAFDDLPMAHLLETPLTVVAQPAYTMGKAAAEILVHRIKGVGDTEGFQQRVFPCELIIRESCGENLEVACE